jgi:ribosomal protein S18 acetylase RimI-like enzyme
MTQTTIIIRPATPADHPFICSLSTRLAMVAQLPGRKEAELQAFQDRHMQAALTKTGAQIVTLVAAMPTGPVLGFIHLHPEPDPVTSEPAGYVSMLAVVPEAEGQGIARQLMAAAEDWARSHGFRCLSLDVFASNERARRFYDRIGFSEDSVKLYKLLK